MADTVEQVYVWDGNDWTPVVRDATVEKTSELTNDGEDGVNPFITAADIPAVPDKQLPIDSADGTVVLDSPSANTFTISTGGSEHFRVDENGRLLAGEGAGENPNFTFHFRSPNTNQLVLESDTGLPQLKVKADDFWYYFSLNPTGDYFRLVSYDGNTNQSFNVFTARPNGDISFMQNVITSRIVGPADNDASIELGTNLIAEVGNGKYQILNNGFHLFDSDGSQSRFTNEGRFLVNTQTADAGYISTFRQSKLGETGVVRFVTDNPDGSVNLFIDCNPSTGIVGLKSNSQVCLMQAEGGTYTPTQPNSIATKQTVDDKIQVMTTAEYNALATKNPTTLYCLTD